MSQSSVFQKVISLTVLCLSLLLAACAPDPNAAAQAAFLEDWQAAHTAGDVEGQLALYCWDGVDATHRSFVHQSLVFEAEYPLVSATIEPLEPDDGYDYVFEGRRYLPNLEPAARLQLVFANDAQLHSSLLLGMQDGRYLLLNPRMVAEAHGSQ